MRTDCRYLFFLGIIALLSNTIGLAAQDPDCMDRYSHASVFFEQGRIDDAYQLLLSCINDDKAMQSVSPENRGRIYKLAAETAMYLGLYDEAELFTREMLEVQPYYEVLDDDLPEFKANIENIWLYPKNIVSLGFFFPNTNPDVIRNLSPAPPTGELLERSDGNMIGIQYKRFLNPKFAVGVGFQGGKIIDYEMVGSSIPVKGRWTYFLQIASYEWPVFCDYNIYITPHIIMYLELGISIHKTGKPVFNLAPEFEIKHSDQFGKYYSVSAVDPEKTVPVKSVAYFYETPLDYDFITGFGGFFNLKEFGTFEIGFRYFPRLIQNDPFSDVEYFTEIPEDDDLHYYDDIFLMRVRNHFQMVITFGVNLNYRTY